MTIHHSDIQLILAQQAQHAADQVAEDLLRWAGAQPLPSTNLGPAILMFDPAEAIRAIRRRALGVSLRCSGRAGSGMESFAEDLADMAIQRVNEIGVQS